MVKRRRRKTAKTQEKSKAKASSPKQETLPRTMPVPPPITKQIRVYLQEVLALRVTQQHPITHEMTEMPLAELVALRLVGKALAGDLSAIKEVIDRVDGKAMQHIQVHDAQVVEEMDDRQLNAIVQRYEYLPPGAKTVADLAEPPPGGKKH